MKQVTSFGKPPDNSIIMKGLDTVDYSDSYRIETESSETIDAITTKMFRITPLEKFLVTIRNGVVRFFGLKTDFGESNEADYYPVGTKAVVFTVIDRNDNEIVMAENDKHLYFRTSMMLEVDGTRKGIYCTTLVKYNNRLGKMYFFVIKPFHKYLIKSSMKKTFG